MSPRPPSAPKVESWMHPEIQQVRRMSPDYIKELASVERSFSGVNHLGATALNGGIMSACYLLPDSSNSLVIKFGASSKPHEGDVMSLWGQNGVKVPTIHDYGIVPSTRNTRVPVSYTLMGAVLDSEDNLAPTADGVVEVLPSAAAIVGKLMGIELGKIHGAAIESSTFGSESIVNEFNGTACSWSEYLCNEVERHRSLLIQIGYSEELVRLLISSLSSANILDSKSYIHNDPSLRNILIPSTDPLEICVIDPNPIIGDIHWDFAHMANKVHSARKRFEAHPNVRKLQEIYEIQLQYYQAAVISYQLETGLVIDDRELLFCQLPRSLKRLAWFSHMGEDETEISIAQSIVEDQVKRIVKDL